MAQLAVAAAGAALGSLAGPGVLALGLTGSQIGWMAGSLLGSALFSETQKSYGPRLSDLKTIGSSYGATIPYVQGHPRISGQIVWASNKREIASTQSAGGKGGPRQEYTSYTYEVDLLILLCDNTIGGITKIWSNGDLVYNVSLTADSISQQNSWSTNLWSRLTVYNGGPTQLPDPTYEASVGTANACAYRGRGSVFIQSLQLGSSGAIPNLTFEIAQASNQTGLYDTYLLCRGDSSKGIADSSVYTRPITVVGSGVTIVDSGGAVNGSAIYTPWIGVVQQPPAQYASYISFNMSDSGTVLQATAIQTLEFNFMAKSWETSYPVADPTYNTIFAIYNTSGSLMLAAVIKPDDARIHINGTVNNIISQGTVTANQWTHFALVRSTTSAGVNNAIYVDGVYLFDISFNNWDNIGRVVFGNEGLYSISNPATYHRGLDILFDEICWTNKAKYTSNFTPTKIQHPVYTHLPTFSTVDTDLNEVVSNILTRSGLSPDKYDVTGIASTGQKVRGLVSSQVGPTKNILEMLAQTYSFDSFCSDKIYFKPKSQVVSLTIPYDDLGADGSENVFNLSKVNNLEIPTNVSLTYINYEKNYQNDTEYSDRIATVQENISTVSVPIVLNSTEAKALADKILSEKYASSISTELHVTSKYSTLQPLDVVNITDSSGNLVLMIVKRIQETDSSVLKLTLTSYNSSIYTQTGLTTTITQDNTVYGPPSTKLTVLQIPPLRDQEVSIPGYYVAVDGNEGNWYGCSIYNSYYTDSNYAFKTSIYNQAVIGVCSSILGTFSSDNIFDETNTLDVVAAMGVLSSTTRDAIINSQAVNAALVGNEIIQFRNAELIANNTYRLSGLLRGRRGTENYISNHVVDEKFVLLGTSGLKFIPTQISDIGKTLYTKVATISSSDTVLPVSATINGQNLECFSPVDARIDRSVSTSHVISWKRRTRKAVSFTGLAGISVPLDETSQLYDLEIYTNNTFSTVKRTKSGLTTNSTTYTSAEQIADFGGLQGVIYIKIYQVSQTVGRGTPLTATL